MLLLYYYHFVYRTLILKTLIFVENSELFFSQRNRKCDTVNNEEFQWLSQYEWIAVEEGNTWYAATHIKGELIYMHDLIIVKQSWEERGILN